MILRTKNEYAHRNRRNVMVMFLSFVLLCGIIIVFSGDSYKANLNKGVYPNCMKIVEYGDAGNEEGCLKHLMTQTPDYVDTFGLHFESFHMKDMVSAKQKYLSLQTLFDKEKVSIREEKIISDNVKVEKIYDNQNHVLYLVMNQTNVYKAIGSKENESRNQRWFEMLNINYSS
ncbi:MAG: hypothetical protein RR630_07210 [Coprobacillus sp.]